VRLPESNEEENCLCFNYFEGGTLINTKYRSGRKHFMMVKGAELIPYNIDAILDTPECIATEGEFDAAAFMTAGRKDVISVPAGAQSNLNWMDRFVESHFEPKKLIYIAVDEDSSGRLLSQELVRRLGSDRCRLVHFGPECKDANEHLIKYGAESLLITLEQAEEIPLEGVFTAKDRQEPLRTLFENGLQRGAETGWANLDENCTFETGRLAVWTGRTGEGKSEFIDELVLRLCLRHEWKIGFFSPENMPMEYHLAKLAEKLTGHPFRPGPGMTEALYNRTTRWLTDNVTHILPDSGSYTVDCILEKARQLVRRRGVRILVVDPLNRIDQQLEPGQTELQYITSLLNKLSRFALQHKCLVILVAHPRKVNRNTTNSELRRVEMNDINGSANFGNMADFCFTVDRNDAKEIVTIYIDKVRFKHLGSANTCAKFVYNRINGRYWPCEEDIVHRADGDKPGPVNTVFDNENWLKNITEESCIFD
jgi:twinkle protein